MRYIGFIIPTLLILLNFMISPAFSQEEIFYMGNEYGINARAMGMGNTRICTAEDFSAAFSNPAALGMVRRMELQGSFSHLKIQDQALFLGKATTDSKNSTKLNTLGFVFPVPTYRGSLVFSIGFARLRDYESSLKMQAFNPQHSSYRPILDEIYPDIYTYYDSTLQDYVDYFIDTTIDDSVFQKETLISSGGLKAWTVSGALEVQKDIFLGASINVWSGSEEHTLTFVEEDQNEYYQAADTSITEDGIVIYDYNDFKSLESMQKINSEFNAINLKIGLLYRMNQFMKLGLTVESPKTFTIKEKWEDESTVNFDDGSYAEPSPNPYSGESEYKIQEPYIFGFGASASLLNFTLAGDVELVDWSQAKFLTDSPIYGETKDRVNTRIKENFTTVTNVHLGGEFSIPFLNTKIRAGYANRPSIFKDARDDEHKKYLSLGASLLLDKQMMLDFGWSHGWWTDYSFDSLTNVEAKEQKEVNRLLATCSIRF
ncbi:outer membrane protein transport protein [candidate division KSB1 bacterium]|nr:outer membrane protein transport protein [candidate division KSB1 bacterium]